MLHSFVLVSLNFPDVSQRTAHALKKLRLKTLTRSLQARTRLSTTTFKVASKKLPIFASACKLLVYSCVQLLTMEPKSSNSFRRRRGRSTLCRCNFKRRRPLRNTSKLNSKTSSSNESSCHRQLLPPPLPRQECSSRSTRTAPYCVQPQSSFTRSLVRLFPPFD